MGGGTLPASVESPSLRSHRTLNPEPAAGPQRFPGRSPSPSSGHGASPALPGQVWCVFKWVPRGLPRGPAPPTGLQRRSRAVRSVPGGQSGWNCGALVGSGPGQGREPFLCQGVWTFIPPFEGHAEFPLKIRWLLLVKHLVNSPQGLGRARPGDFVGLPQPAGWTLPTRPRGWPLAGCPPSQASVSPSVNWAVWEELRGWWSLHLALSFPPSRSRTLTHTHPYHREATTQGSWEMVFIEVPEHRPESRRSLRHSSFSSPWVMM